MKYENSEIGKKVLTDRLDHCILSSLLQAKANKLSWLSIRTGQGRIKNYRIHFVNILYPFCDVRPTYRHRFAYLHRQEERHMDYISTCLIFLMSVPITFKCALSNIYVTPINIQTCMVPLQNVQERTWLYQCVFGFGRHWKNN